MRAELILIETEAELAEAIAVVATLIDSDDPVDTARLRAQARLVEDYERRRWPDKAPTVPALLAYLMDQHDMTERDLAAVLGSADRVRAVLSGRIGLTMTMVRRLRDRFGIPADLLIPATPPRKTAA